MTSKMMLMAAAASAMLTCSAEAATVFSDNFDAYTVGDLVPQGGWTQLGASTTNPLQVTAAKNVGITTGQDAQKTFSSTVLHTDGHSIVTEFDLTAAAADSDPGGDFFLSLNPSIGSTAYSGRIYAQASTQAGKYQLSLAGVSIPVDSRVYGADLDLNTTYHVTATWNFVAGDLNDTFTLQIDGLPYTTAGWGSTDAVNDPEPASFGVLTLRQGGANPSDLLVDNFTVTEVIPEPGSLAVLGLGAFGLVGRRRRG